MNETKNNLPTPPRSVKGTQTEVNLVASFAAESTAYTRYMFYAKQANKERLFPIEHIFEETAKNEMQHAKTFFKYLEGGQVPITITVDAGIIGTTAVNLEIAIREELTEGVETYKKYAAMARLEGFDHIAEQFEAVAKVEAVHKARYECWLKHLNDDTLWVREHPIKWLCLVCGYVHEGTEPPTKCPGCNHPREHFMPLDKC